MEKDEIYKIHLPKYIVPSTMKNSNDRCKQNTNEAFEQNMHKHKLPCKRGERKRATHQEMKWSKDQR